MKQSEARAIVAALIAAYPSRKVERPTEELYTKQIMKLRSVQAAAAAAEALIQAEQWFPSVARFKEAYDIEAARLADERRPRALKEAATDREANLARVRELQEQMGW